MICHVFVIFEVGQRRITKHAQQSYVAFKEKYSWKGFDSIELIHFMGNAFENYLIKTNLLTENHSTTRNGIQGLGCYHTIRSGAKIFCLGPSYGINIFIKINSRIYIYIYIHAHFFIIYTHTYIHTFLFDKLYIYTQSKKKKKRVQCFQSKLCLMEIFHKIKFFFYIFIVKFLKSFILNTNYQVLY